MTCANGFGGASSTWTTGLGLPEEDAARLLFWVVKSSRGLPGFGFGRSVEVEDTVTSRAEMMKRRREAECIVGFEEGLIFQFSTFYSYAD